MKEGFNFTHIVIILLIIGSTFLLMNRQSPTILSSGTFPAELQRNTISVTGSYDLDVAPDQAEIMLTIQTDSSTAKDAQSQNSEISNKVIASLKDQGIKKDDIETTQYSLQRRESYDPKTGRPVFLGYTQVHTLKATAHNLDSVGDVVDAATNTGANRIDGISFTLSREAQKESNQKALKLAAANAQEKADALADALDVNLGKAVTISETNYVFRPTPMPYYGTIAESADMKAEIPPSDVTVSLTVNVVFEIK